MVSAWTNLWINEGLHDRGTLSSRPDPAIRLQTLSNRPPSVCNIPRLYDELFADKWRDLPRPVAFVPGANDRLRKIARQIHDRFVTLDKRSATKSPCLLYRNAIHKVDELTPSYLGNYVEHEATILAGNMTALFPWDVTLEYHLKIAPCPTCSCMVEVRVHNISLRTVRAGRCRAACLVVLHCLRLEKQPLRDLRILVAMPLWQTRRDEAWDR